MPPLDQIHAFIFHCYLFNIHELHLPLKFLMFPPLHIALDTICGREKVVLRDPTVMCYTPSQEGYLTGNCCRCTLHFWCVEMYFGSIKAVGPPIPNSTEQVECWRIKQRIAIAPSKLTYLCLLWCLATNNNVGFLYCGWLVTCNNWALFSQYGAKQ